MRRNEKDSLIAGGITAAAVLAILLVLYFGHVGWDREALAAVSEPETGQEELFLEPDLLTDPGTTEEIEPAPAPLRGEPEPAPVEQPVARQPVSEPDPVPSPPARIAQSAPAPVKESKPKGDEEKQRATSAMAGKFSPSNGSVQGKFDTAGTSASAVGVSGNIHGRQFLGCPKPDVTLSHKTVVKVEISVDASGRVSAVRASSGGTASIRKACEAAARQARWSEKKGAAPTPGSITFTITPR